ncbi:MAG: hypothetical protein QGI05_05105, partial [Candidatus Omnitrophota bacterium]|nr:hypothetical protein [Candidatus Omnitrophota bacterium]
MLKKKIYFIILILLTFASLSFADTIYLKNGNKITGIITKETEESVEIKINIGAVVTFSKKDIEKIEKESDQRHTKMEGSWETEKAKRDVRAISDSDIGEGEWEEGLVEYKGRWVAPEVKERLQAASIAQDIDKTEKERKFSSRQDKEKRSSFAEKLLDKGDWYVRETEHFSIYYEDQASSKIVSDKAEYYFEKIAYDLGYEKEIKWDKKCQVYIVEDIGGWKKFLKGIGFDPELIGGFVPNYEEKE